MRLRKSWLLLVAMFALVLTAAPARAADVDGKWSGNIEGPMGTIELSFTLKADGAALNGSMGVMGMDLPIKNGKVDGDKISFVVSLDFGGMMFDLNYAGAVKGETLDMTGDFMGMPFNFQLKKAK